MLQTNDNSKKNTVFFTRFTGYHKRPALITFIILTFDSIIIRTRGKCTCRVKANLNNAF